MTQELQWIDTHCHVYEENIPGGQEHALQAARDAGVVTMIVIGTDADTTRQAIDIANMHPDVYATVGLHPHDAKNGVETITPFLQSARVVGIGECGLDYYYDHSDRAVQREVFAQQIQLAHELNLPLVIHTREAWTTPLMCLMRKARHHEPSSIASLAANQKRALAWNEGHTFHFRASSRSKPQTMFAKRRNGARPNTC